MSGLIENNMPSLVLLKEIKQDIIKSLESHGIKVDTLEDLYAGILMVSRSTLNWKALSMTSEPEMVSKGYLKAFDIYIDESYKNSSKTFEGDSELVIFPYYDLSNRQCISFFMDCINLREIAGGIIIGGGTKSIFSGCINLYSVNGIKFEQAAIASASSEMSAAFKNCYNLKELKLSDWNIQSKINTSFSDAFLNCRRLIGEKQNGKDTLDVSNINNNYGTYFTNVFNGCKQIQVIKLPNGGVGTSKFLDYAFANCNKLESIVGTIDMSNTTVDKNWTNSHIFDECTSLISVRISHLKYYIDLGSSTNLNAESIAYLLENVDDAVAYVAGTTTTAYENKIKISNAAYNNALQIMSSRITTARSNAESKGFTIELV